MKGLDFRAESSYFEAAFRLKAVPEPLADVIMAGEAGRYKRILEAFSMLLSYSLDDRVRTRVVEPALYMLVDCTAKAAKTLTEITEKGESDAVTEND